MSFRGFKPRHQFKGRMPLSYLGSIDSSPDGFFQKSIMELYSIALETGNFDILSTDQELALKQYLLDVNKPRKDWASSSIELDEYFGGYNG